MKDIPVFDTEHGVATLILKEIPYKEIAYIRVQDAQPGEWTALVEECAAFCRAAGAERIFATGHEEGSTFPLDHTIIKMTMRFSDWEPKANLWPVTEETVGKWRGIYNEKMKPVDNAATLTAWEEKKILASGGAYFVHNSGELLGIGWMEESKLLAICSAKPGAGKIVAQTLFTAADSDQITLEVASTNTRAIQLYEKLGFVPVAEVSRWYRVR